MGESERIFGPAQVAAWGPDLISKLVEESISQKQQQGKNLPVLGGVLTSSSTVPVAEMLMLIETVDPESLPRIIAINDAFELELLRRTAIERRKKGPGLFLCCIVPKAGWSLRYKSYQELRYLSAAFESASDEQIQAEESMLQTMIEYPCEGLGAIATYPASTPGECFARLHQFVEVSYPGRLLLRSNCTLETTNRSSATFPSYITCSGSFGGLAAFLMLCAAWRIRETVAKLKKLPSTISTVRLAAADNLSSWWDTLTRDERLRWCPWCDADKTGRELEDMLMTGCIGGSSCDLASKLETARAEFMVEVLCKEEDEARERQSTASSSTMSTGQQQSKKKRKQKPSVAGAAVIGTVVTVAEVKANGSKCATVPEHEEVPTEEAVVIEVQTVPPFAEPATTTSVTDNMEPLPSTAVPSDSHTHPTLGQAQEADSRTRRGSSSDFSFATISSGGPNTAAEETAFSTPSDTPGEGSEGEDKWEKARNRKRKKELKRLLVPHSSLNVDTGPPMKIPTPPLTASHSPVSISNAPAPTPPEQATTSSISALPRPEQLSPTSRDHPDTFSSPSQSAAKPDLQSPSSESVTVSSSSSSTPPLTAVKRNASTPRQGGSSPSPTSRQLPPSGLLGTPMVSLALNASRSSPASSPSAGRQAIGGSIMPSNVIMLPPPAATSPIIHVQQSFAGQTSSTGLRQIRSSLHRDIQEMAASLELVATRRQPWQLAVAERVKQVVYSVWPRAWCDVFGSIASGLAAPCSDVDMVVRGVPQPDRVRVLAQHLQRQEWVQMVQAVERTAVPVVKFKTAAIPIAFGNRGNLIAVDITFENEAHHGLNTCGLVRQFVQRWPPLKPLVLVLKQFLVEKGLNDPYIGGISSYGLVLMVAAIMKRHWPSGLAAMPSGGTPPVDLGLLFIEFLETYSSRDFVENGVRFGGDAPKPRGDPCYIEDPLDPTNNVGRSCFGIMQVVEVFSKALEAIRAYERDELAQQQAARVLLAPSPATLVPNATSMLGRVFATSHHNDVVRLVTKVWCPPELPAPTSRGAPPATPDPPVLRQQRYSYPPPPNAALPAPLPPAPPTSASINVSGPALERWAADARETLLQALNQIERGSPGGKCPVCSQPGGPEHVSSRCDLYIVITKCPI